MQGREYLSRGQKKLFILSLMFSQLKYASLNNNTITLLLYDVLLELDKSSQIKCINEMIKK